MILLLENGSSDVEIQLQRGIYAVRGYELPLILGLASLVLATTGAGMSLWIT